MQYGLCAALREGSGNEICSLLSVSLWRKHPPGIHGSMNKEPRLPEASVENRYRSAGAYLTFQGGG